LLQLLPLLLPGAWLLALLLLLLLRFQLQAVAGVVECPWLALHEKHRHTPHE
jgi:uncharacterized protein involved in cysteine biosynthesis